MSLTGSLLKIQLIETDEWRKQLGEEVARLVSRVKAEGVGVYK